MGMVAIKENHSKLKESEMKKVLSLWQSTPVP